MPYPVRVLVLGVVTIPHTVVGMMILLAQRPLYTAYEETGRVGGLNALTDQQIGGVLLLLPGEIIMVAAAAVVGIRWFSMEERNQAKADRPVDPVSQQAVAFGNRGEGGE